MEDEESGRAREVTRIAITLHCLHALFSKEVDELLGPGDLTVSAVYVNGFTGQTIHMSYC